MNREGIKPPRWDADEWVEASAEWVRTITNETPGGCPQVYAMMQRRYAVRWRSRECDE